MEQKKAVKFDILVKYLKKLINDDDMFIKTEEVKTILEVLEEGDEK